MPKYQDIPFRQERDPSKTEVRSSMAPFIQPALGDGKVMSAQAHSMAMYDGTTDPHRDALSFDAVTKTEMGNLE